MTLESAIERTQSALYHYQRLMDAFGHHPEEWEWTGDMAEGDPTRDHCACGHNIRWLFPWKRKDGKGGLVITGSVCVENVPGISPDTIERMRAAIAEMEERRKEDARKSREALAKEDAAAADKEWHEVYEARYGGVRREIEEHGYGYLPQSLYSERSRMLYDKNAHYRALRLKSSKVMAKRLRGLSDGMRKELWEGHPLRKAPSGGKRRHAKARRATR